jgi:hypothetical protein
VFDAWGQAVAMEQIGLWVGLVTSLLLASMLLRDNAGARLAQHILVGAGVGYAVVLAVRGVLWPQLLGPLLREPNDSLWRWMVAVLLVLLLSAGTVQIVTAGRGPRWLLWAGAVPVAIVVGAGVAIAALGVVEGTLAPQFLRAAASGFVTGSPLAVVTGVLTLLITSGAIIHLRVNPTRDLGHAPGWVSGFVSAWAAVGRRGLWLAAGVIFARLVASRISLLAARFEYLAAALQQTGLWAWFSRMWETLFG